MDAQFIIEAILVIAGFFGGWVINSLSKSIIRIEDRLSDMPHIYVSKDDYKHDIDEIKGMLSKIFDRLDGKVDKNAN